VTQVVVQAAAAGQSFLPPPQVQLLSELFKLSVVPVASALGQAAGERQAGLALFM
jgi:hypothetical protein